MLLVYATNRDVYHSTVIWYLVLSFLVSLGGVRLNPLGTSATVGLLYQPRMIDDDYGAVDGMRIGRGNRSTRRKPAPVPLCPPQIPHYLTWDQTRAAEVRSQRLTAWAMARPTCYLVDIVFSYIKPISNNVMLITARASTIMLFTAMIKPAEISSTKLLKIDACKLPNNIGFEVFTTVVMKSTIFWDITPCSPSKVNRRFGGTYGLHSACHLLARWFIYHIIYTSLIIEALFLRNVGWQVSAPENKFCINIHIGRVQYLQIEIQSSNIIHFDDVSSLHVKGKDKIIAAPVLN
jgi:hypothetical protein